MRTKLEQGTVVLAVLVLTSCLASPTASLQTANPTPADRWVGLLEMAPYSYTTPLPPARSTAVDGLYSKLDPRSEHRAPCRRCPPFPPVGGEWRLQLDRGVYRVYHASSGWRTLGSFTVSGEHVWFFNDPHCIHAVGIYGWTLDEGELVLEVINDPCGGRLRAECLTNMDWTAIE